jgi:two-component system, NtrC family, sensor histidine kinase PilS
MNGPIERRVGERRQGRRHGNDRRQPQASPHPAESSLTGITTGSDPEFRDSPSISVGTPEFVQGAFGPLKAADQATRPAASAAIPRILRTYLAARAALGLALMGAQVAANSLGANVSTWVMGICAAFALQSSLPWLMPRMWSLVARSPTAPIQGRLWLATIGTDLLAFGLLHALAVEANFNYAALLVLPVLMSGVLTTRTVALGTAAGVALLLLLVSWPGASSLVDSASQIAQSGLAGMGLFVVAVMASELAGRMLREEKAARGSREIARQQAQLNRLVIEEMADGVLVLDRQLTVRAANPAARQLLVAQGLAPATPFVLRDLPSAAGFSALVEQAWAEEEWPEAGRDLQLVFDNLKKRTLRVRVRFTRGTIGLVGAQDRTDEASVWGPANGLCVVWLEDVRTAQARQRQEKLAAMGRVSAGIAHEIRNPLAAIAQANQLLLEEPLGASQRRLSVLVADNVKRLQRVVDDVLELAPGGSGLETRSVEVVAATQLAVLEWAQTVHISADTGEDTQARLKLDVAKGPLPVLFDPEHLRRVLVNLLDNALRHSTSQPQSLMLRLAIRDQRTVVLSLANDGPPIEADVEPFLFEPFFSTRSRGSGLGLYICRELCERYGASIEYRARPPGDRYQNGFVVILQRTGTSPVAAVATPAQ